MSLEGRVALITGAAKGIGRVIALSLARAGANVVVNYKSSGDKAAELVKEIESLGRKVVAVKADVTKEDDVTSLIDQSRLRFGRLDVLVNNVGDWMTKKVEDTTYEEWRRLIDTNLTAAFLCSKHAIPLMRSNGWGRIVNLACAGAYRAHGTSDMAGFYAAKAGVVALTKSLAREVGRDGITVNAVAPGVVEDKERTVDEAIKVKDNQTAMGRPGTSWDIASAILFLASDDASFITGDVLNVTGGWLI